MVIKSHQSVVDLLDSKQPEVSLFDGTDFKRTKQLLGEKCYQFIDSHPRFKVRLCFLNVKSTHSPELINVTLPGNINDFRKIPGLGFIITIDHNTDKFILWFRDLPRLFRVAKNRRLTRLQNPSVGFHWGQVSGIQLSISRPEREDEVVIFSYIIAKNEEDCILLDLLSSEDSERRLYRKSDWFFSKGAVNIWDYLLNGSIYDPRADAIVNKNFICQQCAYSWWSYCSHLYNTTGKRFYDFLQDAIAYSVLLDLKQDTKAGHGFWSDEIETHARFYLDGIHLLLSQFQKKQEPMWIQAAEHGFRFVENHLMEELDEGYLWFMHDTIEHTMPHRFRRTSFGKTPGNSLCLNTHVQALLVLYRLQLLSTNNQKYQSLFLKGLAAMKRILESQPAEYLYGYLMPWVLRSKIEVTQHGFLNKYSKMLKRFIARNLYWIVRSKYPRLAFSNGFIERDLTLSWAADNYHITNIKDLLTLYRQYRLDWLRPIIEKGVQFARQLDLVLALRRSSYYIEWIDILYMYDALIERVLPEEIKRVEDIILAETGGYSLDYFSSALVRGDTT